MYNITLVSTRHEELGECNSSELYKIIETIDPEVIFEEIPPSFFDKYYVHKSHSNLETDTINKYLETHKIEHNPVDSDNMPSESLFQNHKYILGRIEGLADVNGFNYRTCTDTCSAQVQKHGFKYLNSIYCINCHDEIHDAIEKGLQNLNDDKLFETCELWKEINEKRENEMLENIYNYSKDHSYARAIFTVGSADRKSIMQKIQEYERKEELKLNWSFYK
jgi:hypothetical protein